ncbi:hypothetical protein BJX66DRAFT_320454 [Aspergillus keveii]|uniref:Uncharacterized protein n=1 Tax=Aspergillus keveii TaxID=714993 RepID=A0ABR4FH21_9EURO
MGYAAAAAVAAVSGGGLRWKRGGGGPRGAVAWAQYRGRGLTRRLCARGILPVPHVRPRPRRGGLCLSWIDGPVWLWSSRLF